MVSETGHIRKAVAASLLIFAAVASSAYTRREHYAIAVIAEKYLTPEAKAAVNEIFNGERMALYASYPDEYRAVLRIDGHKFYHTFHVDKDLMPVKSKKSPVYVIMNAADKLRYWKSLDPEQRAEYQKGSVIDWAHDSAVCCKDFTRDIRGDENNNAVVEWPYVAEHAWHAKNQAMKAGYRLAAILNEIFK